MQLSNIIYLLTLTSYVSATTTTWYHYNNDFFTYSGCSNALQKGATFCSGKAAKCLCTNKNGLASMLYCGYNNTHVNNHGFNKNLRNACVTYTNKTSDDYYAEIYQYALDNIVDVSTNKSFNASAIVTYPVTSTKIYKSFYNYYITSRNRFGNVYISHAISIAFVAVTFFVLLASGAVNWVMRLSKGVSNSLDSGLTRQFRKFLNLRIFRTHLQPTIMGFNPDAVESFWIFIMFLYSLLSNCIIGHQWYPGDTSFTIYQTGTSRYWGDRSCILLSYQLPFLFLFSGRNNFFQYITRWKYSRFVTYHKWLARIVMMEVLIHSFAMASQTYGLKKWTRFHADWYLYGIVSTVAGCLACTVAVYYVRKHWYEIFLVSHIILVCTFLWTGFIHAASQSYEGFYWCCCAIWIFERFLRICRIAMNGVHNATIEYYPGDDGIIKIHTKKSRFTRSITPGSHAFITFLSKGTFWQSHPFTAFESVEDPDTITFCCRVKKGVTKTISSKITGTGVESINMKILIEGFYGEQSYYQQYDKAVFITGNTGISGPFQHVKKLLASNSNTKVELYWGVRSYDSLKWFAKELLSLKGTNVVPKIYISQPDKSTIGNSSSSDSDHKSGDNESEDKKAEFEGNDVVVNEVIEFADVYHGRMSISEIIDAELKEGSGNVAFGACAHNQVVDTVRREVASRLTSYNYRVDYFEEMQAW